MGCWHIFGKIVSFEIRNGVGFDLEFVDSRPVWTYNSNTQERSCMALNGVIILIPFFLLSIGNIWMTGEEEE